MLLKLSRERTSRVALLSFWPALLLITGLRAFVGLYGTRIYAHDAFMTLDGAWRMLNGQRPHVDFNSMVGPAAYLPTVIGLQLSHLKVEGFGYGQALVGFLTGAWAWCLARRTHPLVRAALGLAVACIAASPAQLGPDPLQITPGMTYNRVSYALLALLLIECFGPEEDHQPGMSFFSGLSSGVLLGTLAFLKVTACFVSFGLILVFAVIWRRSLVRWIGVLTGAVITSLAFLTYLHFRIDLVLSDLSITAGAKHLHTTGLYEVGGIFFEAVMALVVSYGTVLALRSRPDIASARKLELAALLTTVISVLLVFGNYQSSELPLVFVLLLLLADPLLRSLEAVPNRTGKDHSSLLGGDPLHRLALLGVGAYLSVLVFSNVVAFGVATLARLHTVKTATRFDSPVLAAFVPIGRDYSYVYFVNDGLQIVRQFRRPGESLITLDFADPLSYGLLIPPAPGGTTNLQFRGSFDDQHHLTPQKLFGAADLVMLPLEATDPDLTSSTETYYLPYLQQHYTPITIDDTWALYRRNP